MRWTDVDLPYETPIRKYGPVAIRGDNFEEADARRMSNGLLSATWKSEVINRPLDRTLQADSELRFDGTAGADRRKAIIKPHNDSSASARIFFIHLNFKFWYLLKLETAST